MCLIWFSQLPPRVCDGWAQRWGWPRWSPAQGLKGPGHAWLFSFHLYPQSVSPIPPSSGCVKPVALHQATRPGRLLWEKSWRESRTPCETSVGCAFLDTEACGAFGLGESAWCCSLSSSHAAPPSPASPQCCWSSRTWAGCWAAASPGSWCWKLGCPVFSQLFQLLVKIN